MKVDILQTGYTRYRLIMKQSEIESMSVAEKLQTIEALWDTLDDESLESPDWHLDVLNERKKSIESGEAKFISLETLKGYKF